MSPSFMYRLALLIILFCVTTQISLAANKTVTTTTTTSQVPHGTLASKNFWQLNQVLAFYQNMQKEPWPEIPSYPAVLKPGTKSSTILLLRQRLKTTGDLALANDIGGSKYDHQLASAVKNFQARHGLKVDGVVGEDTRIELNIPPDVRVRQIAINMQRWADLANKLGDRFIMVNIPDFHMYLIENDKAVLMLRAIVGKRELPTPELSSKITRIVLNPYWNIPSKIAKNDIAPKMLADPDYIYRMHIRAFRNEDDDASQINPDSINWQAAAEAGLNYHLRQDPGPENALGLVKFEFQNEHDVYMHDTSAKDLFNTDSRDYSHGCIRLENPFALVEYLMKDSPKMPPEKIQEILDTGQTRYVKVPHPIPIFITYITAWVDDTGQVNFRDDLYQLDENALSLTNNEKSIYQ